VCGFAVDFLRSCYSSEWMFPGVAGPVKGYFYFCDEKAPHYPEWHFFGSRNWHQNDGTPEPDFGETASAQQIWRDGSFATLFPDPVLVGTQACIELGIGEGGPGPTLIAGVDVRCWKNPPPWGGLAGGGASSFFAGFGGLAGGGDSGFFAGLGGLAGGGNGSFEVQVMRPLFVANEDGGASNPIPALTETYLPWLNLWIPGDGTTLFPFGGHTAWASPVLNTIYEYHCEVWIDAGGAVLSTDFVELRLTDGGVGGVWHQIGVGELIIDAALGGSGNWFRCALHGFAPVSGGGFTRFTPIVYTSLTTAFVSNPNFMYVQSEFTLIVEDLGNF